MSSDVALLRALYGAGERGVPPADLATQLGLAPALLESRLRALRIAGFQIESRTPGAGLRLLAGPRDRLVADDLRARLARDCVIGREVVVLAETDSTNDVAARAGAGSVAEGLVVFAECQRAGRGRHGRQWSSERGLGLWFSVLLRPGMPIARWSGLALMAALAVAEAAEAGAGVVATIKWPNDVLVNGRKVAGILVEARPTAPQMKPPWDAGYAVVGIGVNVGHRGTDFPEELRDRAGSLAQAAGRLVERSALAITLLRRLEVLYLLWQTHPAAIALACSTRCDLVGQLVRSSADPQIEGVVEGFDFNGRLVLRRRKTGDATTIATGGIIPLVPDEGEIPREKKTGSR